jgi:hypothetical protein
MRETISNFSSISMESHRLPPGSTTRAQLAQNMTGAGAFAAQNRTGAYT